MKNLEVEKMLKRKPVMPLNLQYFAEKKDGKEELGENPDDDAPEDDNPEDAPDDDDPDDDNPDDDSEGESSSGKREKKFTQEEVNEIVRKRVLKERRELRKKNVKGKKTVKDASKETDDGDDPDNDDLKKERLRAEKAEKRLAYYERRDSALEAGVDKRFAKFVVHEVLEFAEDEDDFEDALEEYLEENPQYLEEKRNDSDPDEEELPKKRKPKFSTNSKDGEDKGKKSYKPPKII